MEELLLEPSSAPALELDDVLETVGYGRFQRRLLLLTGATQCADAMELLLIAFLPRQVRCTTDWGHSLDDSSLSTAVFCGMLLGALGAGVVADRWGRRAAFIGTTALSGIGGCWPRRRRRRGRSSRCASSPAQGVEGPRRSRSTPSSCPRNGAARRSLASSSCSM